MIEPTRMQWASPLLHAAMNLHLATDDDRNDPEDVSFWATEALLSIDEIDLIWDKGCAQYWYWVENDAPQIVRDFYDQVGSLHDATYEVLLSGGMEWTPEVTLNVVKEDGSKFEIKFQYDTIWSGKTAPDFFCGDGHVFLYDEFHFDDKLSYHFTSNSGKEWAFYGVRNMTWEKK